MGELSFKTIKPATPLVECERVGAGTFRPEDISVASAYLETFLSVPMQTLENICIELASQPNMDHFSAIGLAVDDPAAMYISMVYKLRSGRDVYNLSYLDHKLSHRMPPNTKRAG